MSPVPSSFVYRDTESSAGETSHDWSETVMKEQHSNASKPWEDTFKKGCIIYKLDWLEGLHHAMVPMHRESNYAS